MFWLLHTAALLFFFPALFLTIPLHIISNNQRRANGEPVTLADKIVAKQHAKDHQEALHRLGRT